MTPSHSAARRTARLILDHELGVGEISEEEACCHEILKLVPPYRTSTAAFRALQRIRMKARSVDGLELTVGVAAAMRAEALGQCDSHQRPPRILVRVDEFPYASAYDDPERHGTWLAERFHEVMVDAGVPYLMAVVPQLAHAYLDPHAAGGRPLNEDELSFLNQLRRDGVALGQHGTTHRTRSSSPRRRSELCGLEPAALGALLDEGAAALKAAGLTCDVLVPPFNRFDADQWPTLESRYKVVTGGPESVALLGAQPAPTFVGRTVYLPCYPPLYGDASKVLHGVRRAASAAPGSWIPIVLHTSWEAKDDFRALRRLAHHIAGVATPWDEFLAAIARSDIVPGSPEPDQPAATEDGIR